MFVVWIFCSPCDSGKHQSRYQLFLSSDARLKENPAGLEDIATPCAQAIVVVARRWAGNLASVAGIWVVLFCQTHRKLAVRATPGIVKTRTAPPSVKISPILTARRRSQSAGHGPEGGCSIFEALLR